MNAPTESIALVADMHLAPLDAGEERAQSELDRPARRARHVEAVLEQIVQRQPAAVLFAGDNANQPRKVNLFSRTFQPKKQGF